MFKRFEILITERKASVAKIIRTYAHEPPKPGFFVDVYCSNQRFLIETGFLWVSPNNFTVGFGVGKNHPNL